MTILLLMKRVNGKQSALASKLEDRAGSLRQGRYQASTIQQDAYLFACPRYLEMNPIRARIVRALAD